MRNQKVNQLRSRGNTRKIEELKNGANVTVRRITRTDRILAKLDKETKAAKQEQIFTPKIKKVKKEIKPLPVYVKGAVIRNGELIPSKKTIEKQTKADEAKRVYQAILNFDLPLNIHNEKLQQKIRAIFQNEIDQYFRGDAKKIKLGCVNFNMKYAKNHELNKYNIEESVKQKVLQMGSFVNKFIEKTKKYESKEK